MSNENSLSENEIDHDPFVQFNSWYKMHLSSGTTMANSVSLGTSDVLGNVSVRTVLLKEFSNEGFIFYTNYSSRKGQQLLSNPGAALLFFWPELSQQVRIEGLTVKIPEEDSIKYFNSRPRESQISAWASKQSTIVPNREHLENNYRYYENLFSNLQIKKPEYWGGFRLIPDWFEFWTEGEHRLHDRLTYTLEDESWIIRRLAP
jgi:pyridoxamine 5'-phosphate oxidase